jgi:4'-phosphopantetheinyl transferase EntD
MVIREILHPAVASAESFVDTLAAPLFPEERALVAGAVDKHRREFATARECARTALAELGVPPVPILRGERGSPVWPQGIVGSITHCAGYRAAAVAYAAQISTIGIDAEPNAPLPNGVIDIISLPLERSQLQLLATERPDVCWDRLIFSAKESIYKAWFPLTRRWLGFEDAAVAINEAEATFGVRLLAPTPLASGFPLGNFTGRWLVSGGVILTAVTVPVQQRAQANTPSGS